MQCIGHGGASALAPANSIQGFRVAAAHGADVIEFDVRAAAGELVLAHSPLRALLPGCLRLNDALRELAGDEFAGLGFVADLKTRGAEGPTVDALRRHGLRDRTLIASQCRPLLARVQEADAGARLGISIGGPIARRVARWRTWRDELAVAIRERGYHAVMLHQDLAHQSLVDQLREIGAEVHVWTVDCVARARELVALDVDGVITNDPRVVREASGLLLLSAPSSPGPSAAPPRCTTDRRARPGTPRRRPPPRARSAA